MIVEEQLKQIDYSLNIQVFNGPNQKRKAELEIKKQAQLGSGSQGDVYKVRIKGMRGSHVDKMRKVHNNKQLAHQVLSDMYAEFCIAKDLCHPGIVEYKYFMRTYDTATKEFEFHILMELLEGGDMDCYIKE
jgi:serine/threonine protein kinase